MEGHATHPWTCVARILLPPQQWSKHPTYRNHSEDGINHACTNSGVDRLLDTCILEDSCRVIEHLTGNKRCNCEIQLCIAVTWNPPKNQLRKVPEVKEYFPGILFNHGIFSANNDLLLSYLYSLLQSSSILATYFHFFFLLTMLLLTAPFSLFLKFTLVTYI